MPNTNDRQFSYADPVSYNGSLFPSSQATISDNGSSRVGKVFADAGGQYYYLNDSGTPVPAMLSNTLEEVVVTPSQQDMLANAFGSYLTMSNDRTKVSNVPHREYNPHLQGNAIRGAKYHAQWEREHPNASSWAYAASAAPFAVAATPIALGAGDALAGTALGQAAINGANTFMANPLVEMANTATGLGFGAKGAVDIANGEFTPGTAMDLVGLPIGWRSGRKLLLNALERKLGLNATVEAPNSIFREVIRPTGNVGTADLIGNDANAVSNARTYAEDAEDFADSFFNNTTPTTSHLESWEDVDLSSNAPSVTIFKARDTRKGELPYTKEEIEALVNPDGTLKENVILQDRVKTGSHGNFYWGPNNFFVAARKINPDTPIDVLKKHLGIGYPNSLTPKQELQKIMNDNPTGKSGILIQTHSGDTSIDSTPLAYAIAARLGKRFQPLKRISVPSGNFGFEIEQDLMNRGRVTSNNFGYNNIFKESKAEAERAKVLLESNPNAEVKLLRDENGNMIAYELTDDNGTFQIPLRSRNEVLDVMNKRLHSFNANFGTSYSDIVPFNNESGIRFDSTNPYPWYFGERFELPDIYGIAYKKGGKLKRRKGLTF